MRNPTNWCDVMKTLRRYDLKNADYFITVVTYKREKLLHLDIELFWKCWNDIKPKAWVILPDHFHIIINSGSCSISRLIQRFKIKYSRLFRDRYRPGRVWQNRFWDHVVRDQDDLSVHLNYIHYNPVKHGFTDNPFTFVHSSLMRYFENGFYSRDWGAKEKIHFEGEFGE